MKKLSARLQRFMANRNGSDTLIKFTLYVYIVLVVLNFFLKSDYLFALEVVVIVYAFFRIFSKNIYQRRKENQAFVGFFQRIKKFFVRQKNKFRDRKTHSYKKCPHCKRFLRLKKIKGHHEVKCPLCHQDFSVKI